MPSDMRTQRPTLTCAQCPVLGASGEKPIVIEAEQNAAAWFGTAVAVAVAVPVPVAEQR